MNALGKATLSIKPHHTHPDTNVVEVHYGGQLVCTVYGNDGPGVRVVSEHTPIISRDPTRPPIRPGEPYTPGVVGIIYPLKYRDAGGDEKTYGDQD